MSNASTAYHLNVHVAPKDIQALKQSGYKMYIAKKCNDMYNVVWAGQRQIFHTASSVNVCLLGSHFFRSFLQNNDFTWVNKYRVFAIDTFADGEVVKTSASSMVDITPGKLRYLDTSDCMLSNPSEISSG